MFLKFSKLLLGFLAYFDEEQKNMFGGQNRGNSQGKDLGGLFRAIWRVFLEILPLQETRKKLRESKENVRKA